MSYNDSESKSRINNILSTKILVKIKDKIPSSDNERLVKSIFKLYLVIFKAVYKVIKPSRSNLKSYE